MSPMRVVVTGGREYTDAATVDREMQKVMRSANGRKIVFINGGARGLDTLVKEWCEARGIPCITMFAPWKSHYEKRSGTIRNQWMIDFGLPTFALVFPGGRGTADMLQRLKDCKINYHVVA
jgi:hypothetical protein